MSFRADGIGALAELPARLVDDDRAITFEAEGTTAMGRRDVFRLTVGSQSVMLRVSPPELGADGRSHVRRDLEVGLRMILGPGRDFAATSFADELDRRKVELAAIEALIAYGRIFDGLGAPDGYYQVEHNGQLYRASTFK